MKPDTKKILITLLLIHIFALILSACSKSGENNALTAAPCTYDAAGNCFQIGPNANLQDYPFIENASILDMGQFRNMMRTDFPWSPLLFSNSKCSSWGGVNCKSIQIMIQQINGSNYNIAIRGLAVNPGRNVYWGNNNLMQNMASSTVTFPAVAQTRARDGVTSVRFQQTTQNAYNGFAHAGYEHTLNHLYLETDGPLSNSTVNAKLYYNGGYGTATVLTATLVKGRDYP